LGVRTKEGIEGGKKQKQTKTRKSRKLVTTKTKKTKQNNEKGFFLTQTKNKTRDRELWVCVYRMCVCVGLPLVFD